MKVQIEISDKAIRKVAALALLAAKDDEAVRKVEEQARKCRESEEPFILDSSIFDEGSGDMEFGLACVVFARVLN